MVDEATKKTLAAIPLLKTKAGPRDKDSWVIRLKEEYSSLIKVSQSYSIFLFCSCIKLWNAALENVDLEMKMTCIS